MASFFTIRKNSLSLIVIFLLSVPVIKVFTQEPPDNIKFLGRGVMSWFITPQYKATLVEATVAIDSLWSVTEGNNKIKYYTRLYVVNVKQFDSTLYSNAKYFSSSSDSLISYTPADLFTMHIDSGCFWDVHIGDTLKDVFIFQENFQLGSCFWTVCSTKSLSIHEKTLPFHVTDALKSLDVYLTFNNIYKGYSPPKDKFLKIGPVFYFDKGDPGWQVTAYSDKTFWYFVHYAGSGDCPCGCTEWEKNTYKVSQTGAVEKIGTLIQRPVTDTHKNFTQPYFIVIYDISGRKISKVMMKKDISGNAFIKTLVTPGIYFLKNPNGTVVSIMKYDSK